MSCLCLQNDTVQCQSKKLFSITITRKCDIRLHCWHLNFACVLVADVVLHVCILSESRVAMSKSKLLGTRGREVLRGPLLYCKRVSGCWKRRAIIVNCGSVNDSKQHSACLALYDDYERVENAGEEKAQEDYPTGWWQDRGTNLHISCCVQRF